MLPILTCLVFWSTTCHVIADSRVRGLGAHRQSYPVKLQQHYSAIEDASSNGSVRSEAYADSSDAPVGFEEMEAMVVESSSSMLVAAVVRGTLGIGKSVRCVGDTTTNIVSGGLKSTGGLLNLFSEAIKELTLPLVTPYAPTHRMPDRKLRIGRKVGKIVWTLASGIHMLSTLLQLLGDTTESATIGFGQSVEDSFSGLVFVMSQIRRGSRMLLLPVRSSHTISEENESESLVLPEINSKGSLSNDIRLNRDDPGSVEDEVGRQESRQRHEIENVENTTEGDCEEGATSTKKKAVMQEKVGRTVKSGMPISLFSLATQIYVAFLAVVLIALRPQSKGKKYVYICILSMALAVLLRSVEWCDKSRFYTQARVRSISEYLHSQVVDINNNAAIPKHEYDERMRNQFKDFESVPRSLPNMERFEASMWANVVSSALWKAQDDFQERNGNISLSGLGAYMSGMMFDIITEEMEEIPQGTNKFTLRKFNFGSEPPLIKAIRCTSRRDSVCLNHKSIPGDEEWSASSSCMHIVVDIDFAYASKDMDTVFTFRSDEIKSLLPEASITFSEVLLEGIFRIDVVLTPAYPFLGNATVSFLELPMLDVSISITQGFSNIDVASIPGVYNFLNSTLTSMLAQYTYPKSGALDVGRNLCPSCYEEAHKPGEQVSFSLLSLFGDLFKSRRSYV